MPKKKKSKMVEPPPKRPKQPAATSATLASSSPELAPRVVPPPPPPEVGVDIEVQPQGRGEVLMAKDIGKRVSSLNGHKGRWEKAGQPEAAAGGAAAAQPPPDGELSRAIQALPAVVGFQRRRNRLQNGTIVQYRLQA